MARIDWLKAEEQPEHVQKIEGKYLLELRTKINTIMKKLYLDKEKLDKAISFLID